MIIIRFLYDNAHNKDEPVNTSIKPLFQKIVIITTLKRE